MPRNFFRRIEVAFPIEQKEEEEKILHTMHRFLQDNEFAAELKSTGKYNHSPKRRKLFSVQEQLIAETKEQIAKQVEASLRSSSGKANDQGEGNQKNP